MIISLLVFYHVAFAQGRVSAIGVKGNQKIETTAILEKISTKKGSTYSRKSIRQDIQSLFDMGYFEDIRVDKVGDRLVFQVKEKPAVAVIEFDGNSELDDDELHEKIAIKSYELVNYNKIQKAIIEIQKAYEEKGYLLAQVGYKLKPMPNQESGVKLLFDIDEKLSNQLKSFCSKNFLS